MNHYDISQLQITTLNTGYAEHHSDWNWQNVRSPFARLYYVTEGEAWVKMENRRIHLQPGHIYMIPPFTVHSNICTGRFCHYYIHIYEAPVDFSFLEQLSYPHEAAGTSHDRELFCRLMELNPSMQLPESNPQSYDNSTTLLRNIAKNKQRQFCDIVESRGILFILLARFLKGARPKQDIKDERISSVVGHIRRHITEPMDIPTLARRAFMSEDHFIRMFRKELGETPNSYVIRLKMERAELLLVTTRQPIKNIAALLGYDEVPYFNRIFKKKVGKTPKEYRMGKTE